LRPVDSVGDVLKPVLKAFEHHLALSLVVPKVPEEPFLVRTILADPLQVSLHEALYVLGNEM
jgi:hypothetical protein